MAYNIDEKGKITKKESGKIAESFMGVSGETGPMTKKEYKKFQQFIKDTTPAGPIQDYRLKTLKKQFKFKV